MQKSCCPPDSEKFLGEDPEYTPQGSSVSYDDVNAYVVGSGSRSIIFVHDMFGLNSGMNKQICDILANRLKDTVVIAPDFFPFGLLFPNDPLKERGAALLPKLLWAFCCCKFSSYMIKGNWEDSSGSIFDRTTTFLINERGTSSIGVLGFCWGTYVGFKACSSALHKDKIFCNISCHPSVEVLASTYKYKAIDLVDAVNCPQMIAATKQEPASWKQNGAVHKLLSSKPFGDICEYYSFQEMHGFVTRGDTKKEATRVAIDDCLNKIVAFVHKTTPSILNNVAQEA